MRKDDHGSDGRDRGRRRSGRGDIPRSPPRRGSTWIAAAAVALLAMAAWNASRGPADAPVAVHAPAGAEHRATQRALPTATPASRAPVRSPTAPVAAPAFLPPQALATLQRIAQGGPHPYRQDDGVFGNREGRLPSQPRGYYREYTVNTPGEDDRGARRIVSGGRPPVEYFYTDDHYRSFRRFTLDTVGEDAAPADGRARR